MKSAAFFAVNCYKCDCRFWLPADLHGAAHKSRHIHFYCPYGHIQCFDEKRQPKPEPKVEQSPTPETPPDSGSNVIPFKGGDGAA